MVLTHARAGLTALALALLLTAAHTPPERPPAAGARQTAPAAPARGGSNYFTHQVDADCEREPYGVVNSYDKAPDVIERQVTQMARAGQKRLRIPVYHHRGQDSGTVMDSTGGRLDAANVRNLSALLRTVKSAGFEAVEVGFFPQDANDPTGWAAFDQGLYEENWGIVRQVRSVVARSGLAYTLDLLNEGAPPAGERVWLRYAKTLWQDYRRSFGVADTVGFSMTVWIAGRVPQLPEVYGDSPPPVLEIHLYGQPGENGDEYQQFMAADEALDEIGYRQPVIVGETYYDDAVAADGIRRAVADARRPVLHLTQWPILRRAKCPAADVAPPVAYDAYAAAGF
ncbi:hypothetical protein [Streptomyces sp. bgisy032]|uniref:hypothetical protein n=1 Tax=Streptomyces sp. bgisy032 TaxID=3413773 RepID=UPI003D759205